MTLSHKDQYLNYLGDGVYARFDGYHVILSLDGEAGSAPRIHLEPPVWERLVAYRKQVMALEAERIRGMEKEVEE